jgi:hypothetical protein
MKNALVIGALIAAVLIPYHNALPGQFIYDDKAIIAKNPLIRNLHHTPLLFGTSYWGMNVGQPKEFKGDLYRPLTMTTYALNFAAGGLNPARYHIVNLLLHLGVVLLLWRLVLLLGFSPIIAGITAFFFAVIPIHTEAVTNIVGRAELLSAFFVLLAWILSIAQPSRWRIAGGAACFGLALLSKENSAAFWPVLILSDYVVQHKSWRELAHERLLIWTAYGGTLLLYLEWRHFIVGSLFTSNSVPYFESQGLSIRLLTMARFMVLHYVKPMLMGWGLCADYTRPALTDANLHAWGPWLCLIVLLGIIGAALLAALKRRTPLALGVLIFFGLLFPVSNLWVRLEVIGAERFLYLPSLGYCFGLGLLAEKASRSRAWVRAAGIFFLVSLALGYGWNTVQRNKVWQSEAAFWETTARDAPGSPRAWNGLGGVRMGQKIYPEALEDFNRALALNPMLLDAHYNMATCFLLKGDVTRAKKGYIYVLQRKPYDPATLFHLAMLAENEGDYKSAAGYYRTMLIANPGDEVAQTNLDKIEGIKRRAVGG